MALACIGEGIADAQYSSVLYYNYWTIFYSASVLCYANMHKYLIQYYLVQYFYLMFLLLYDVITPYGGGGGLLGRPCQYPSPIQPHKK